MFASPRLPRILVNKYEEHTDRVLRDVAADNGHRLLAKVRTIDVLDREMVDTATSDMRAFAFRSHLDFVMVDADSRPLFAVEVDGRQHVADQKQRIRDQKKDDLCLASGLPLLRIGAEQVFESNRRWQLISYICDAYYNACAFYAAQEKGCIPLDEPFFHGTLTVLNADGTVKSSGAYDTPAIAWLHRQHEDGRLPCPSPDSFTVRDGNRGVWTLAYMPVTPELYLRSSLKVRAFNFLGIGPSDLSDELATVEIARMAYRWISGRPNDGLAVSSQQLERDIERLQLAIDEGRFLRSYSGGQIAAGHSKPSVRIRFGGS